MLPYKLKVYISHGSLEKERSADARQIIEKLKGPGVSVKYIVYEGIGHDLPEPIHEELRKILLYLNSKTAETSNGK